MFQRLRDWWTLHSASAFSPEYAQAMERRMPGYLAIQASAKRDAEDRHRREAIWWESVVAMQEAGRIEEAVRQIQMNMQELNRFVLDPLERIGMLYAREVDRLLSLQDRDSATAAAREAIRWMSIWASHSTSGGEGTARSRATAEFEAQLGQKLATATDAAG
jgi:hypothetical protein